MGLCPLCSPGVEEAAEGGNGPPGQGEGGQAAHTRLVQGPASLYSRSVPVHLDGIDAVLGPALALQEGAVFLEL